MSVVFNCSACDEVIKTEESGGGAKMVDCPHCGEKVKVPEMELEEGDEVVIEKAASEANVGPGTIIRNNYKLEEKIGESSLGDVYVASVTSDNRKVLLEILDGDDQESIERLSREIELLASMDHPNIFRAFDAGQDNDIFFLASEYEEGLTVEKILEDGPVDCNYAIGYLKGITLALKYAWDEKKLLHRDVKSSNIFITEEGEARLMGFGIAKSSEGQNLGLTGVGFTVGTPEYMSPEQIKAEELDFRSDMYAIGVVMYEMVTGKLPFIDSSPMEIMRMHMAEEPVPAKEVNPEVTDDASNLIQRLLQKEREDRFDSWEALIAEIDRITAGGAAPAAGSDDAPAAPEQDAVEAPPVQASESTEKKPEKKGCGAAALAVFSLTAVALYVTLF